MHRTRNFLLTAAVLCLVCYFSLPVWGAPGTAPDIPAGTEIHVRMIDSLSSGKASSGDIFHGTLEEPIVANGKVLYPKGSDVTGTVVAVHPSGRLTDPGELSLILNTIGSRGVASSVTVQPLQIKGESHTKNTAVKAGGGAVLGAIIGGLAGGGKGAAIGAGAGAAAGTGAAAATGKREAVVESEAVLSFVTTEHPVAGASPASVETSPATSVPPVAETASRPPSSEPAAEPGPTDKSYDSTTSFSARDRRVIRNCLSEHAAELPPSVMEREAMPSGSDRLVRAGETLPLELQKKAQALPLACEEQLPSLPNDLERAVYSGRVLLLDSSSRILDLFNLDGTN